MPKFVVYEVWTRCRVVEAPNAAIASSRFEPAIAPPGLNLSNWHVVPVDSPYYSPVERVTEAESAWPPEWTKGGEWV